MIPCPKCDGKSKVVGGRVVEINGIPCYKRRRRCTAIGCYNRFYTVETLESDLLAMVDYRALEIALNAQKVGGKG